MNDLLAVAGRAAGVLGLLLSALACLARLAGYYTVGNIQSITLLQLGIAALVAGSFLLLWSISLRR
ncbi:MAG: hypothetical protein KDH17_19855 [Rhodocyclaceae bacterium]|nr:hypothetical protein [Rhodocyclaceae bacterium]